jgi:hypothetical protein
VLVGRDDRGKVFPQASHCAPTSSSRQMFNATGKSCFIESAAMR